MIYCVNDRDLTGGISRNHKINVIPGRVVRVFAMCEWYTGAADMNGLVGFSLGNEGGQIVPAPGGNMGYVPLQAGGVEINPRVDLKTQTLDITFFNNASESVDVSLIIDIDAENLPDRIVKMIADLGDKLNEVQRKTINP